MSLLDKASLIVTPNGYSEDTLYSVVPSSGAGDLSFARATDAWRTNSQGLVQRVCWNLLQYSEQFENVAWTKSNGTITTNAILAPNGTLTADSFTKTSAINTVSQVGSSSTVFANIGVHTLSVYIKPNIGNEVLLRLDNSGNTANSSFNFTTKTFTNSGANIISSSFVELPNGWFRLSIVGNVTTLGWTVTPCNLFSNPLGDSMFIWGAQLVEGSSALEYFPTTDRQNVPRIDYSLGGCPTLLMEPQRTNGVTESARMYNWGTFTALGATSPTNVIATGFQDPTGQSSACLVTGTNGSTGSFGIFQLLSTTYTTGTVLTVSVYAKRGTNDFLYLSQANISFTGTGFAYFNLATGTTPTAGAQIVNVGNGWYRCIMPPVTLTANTGASYNVGHYIAPSETNMIWSTNYLGKSMYFYGAQVEAGSYPTSYIPTTTASMTRNQDVATKVGISSLFGQTEGTVFYEMSIPQPLGLGNQVFANVSNDAGTQLFYNAFINSTGSFVFDIYIAGIYIFTLTTSAAAVAGRNRVALVYKAGAYKVFLNGVLVATSTNSTPITNTISRPTLTGNTTPVYYYEFAAFKSALSDSELELLTGNYFDSYAKMAAFYNYTLQ